MSAPRYATHHDGIAVDVKDHEAWAWHAEAGPLARELESARVNVETIYEGLRDDFWRDADTLAEDAGYREVFAAGRSGGWLGVITRAGRPLELEWRPDEIPAGPLDEWESEEAERAREFGAFAAEVVSLMATYRAMYVEALRDALAELERRRESVLIRGTS